MEFHIATTGNNSNPGTREKPFATLERARDAIREARGTKGTCLETGDVGAIYTGRDWTYQGNVIRYNFIERTGGVGMGSNGVYLDDNVSGLHIHDNVFYRVPRAMYIGGGRDNTAERNLFVDCDPAVWGGRTRTAGRQSRLAEHGL